MARITFEFENRADLDRQLEDFLGIRPPVAAQPPVAQPVASVAPKPEPPVQSAAPALKPESAAIQEPLAEAPKATPAVSGLTVDTLPAAAWADLLAFCKDHPEVGVNAEKCTAPFFRPMVEMRIKNYLLTKV